MRVHIHANCQSVALAQMLREVHPDWNITSFEVHADPIMERIDDHRAWVQSADVVLSQHIHAGYRDKEELCSDWIRNNVRRDATFLLLTSIHFTGHQVGLDATPLTGLPLFSNLIAAHLAADGQAPEAVARLMISENLLADSDIEKEICVSLEETRRREEDNQIDIKIGPYLQQHCRSRLLQHVYNHPYREVMACIVNQILARLGSPSRVSIEGVDYQPIPHVPPLPAVSRFLRERGGNEVVSDDLVILPGEKPASQLDYLTRMAYRFAELPPAELRALIATRWPTVEVLRRLAASGSAIPGIEYWAAC